MPSDQAGNLNAPAQVDILRQKEIDHLRRQLDANNAYVRQLHHSLAMAQLQNVKLHDIVSQQTKRHPHVHPALSLRSSQDLDALPLAPSPTSNDTFVRTPLQDSILRSVRSASSLQAEGDRPNHARSVAAVADIDQDPAVSDMRPLASNPTFPPQAFPATFPDNRDTQHQHLVLESPAQTLPHMSHTFSTPGSDGDVHARSFISAPTPPDDDHRLVGGGDQWQNPEVEQRSQSARESDKLDFAATTEQLIMPKSTATYATPRILTPASEKDSSNMHDMTSRMVIDPSLPIKLGSVLSVIEDDSLRQPEAATPATSAGENDVANRSELVRLVQRSGLFPTVRDIACQTDSPPTRSTAVQTDSQTPSLDLPSTPHLTIESRQPFGTSDSTSNIRSLRPPHATQYMTRRSSETLGLAAALSSARRDHQAAWIQDERMQAMKMSISAKHSPRTDSGGSWFHEDGDAQEFEHPALRQRQSVQSFATPTVMEDDEGGPFVKRMIEARNSGKLRSVTSLNSFQRSEWSVVDRSRSLNGPRWSSPPSTGRLEQGASWRDFTDRDLSRGGSTVSVGSLAASRNGSQQPPFAIPVRRSSTRASRTRSEVREDSPMSLDVGPTQQHAREMPSTSENVATVRDTDVTSFAKELDQNSTREDQVGPAGLSRSDPSEEVNVVTPPAEPSRRSSHQHTERPYVEHLVGTHGAPIASSMTLSNQPSLTCNSADEAISVAMSGTWFWEVIGKRRLFGGPTSFADKNNNNLGLRRKRWLWLLPSTQTLCWNSKGPVEKSGVVRQGTVQHFTQPMPHSF